MSGIDKMRRRARMILASELTDYQFGHLLLAQDLKETIITAMIEFANDPMFDCSEDWKDINTEKVTRVEVIDGKGRVYTKWEDTLQVEVQLQDNERTLKIFIYE